MGLAANPPELILFAFGIIGGIIPCLLWGKLGGDEQFLNPQLKPLLKLIHHWHIGVGRNDDHQRGRGNEHLDRPGQRDLDGDILCALHE